MPSCYEGGDHIVCGIHFRGKTDSVILECSCGHQEIWAEWYGTDFAGWRLDSEMVGVLTSFLGAVINSINEEKNEKD